MDGSDYSLAGILVAGLGVLAKVIQVLYKKNEESTKELQDRSDECESDRRRLWAELATVRARLDATDRAEDQQAS